MIAQVSYLKSLERLLDITNLFEYSRLFRKQWRNSPAVAIASLIINAYKRPSVLTAQNADVAQTTMGKTNVRFMTNMKIQTHVLTTNKSAHGNMTSLFACHCSVEANRLLLPRQPCVKPCCW